MNLNSFQLKNQWVASDSEKNHQIAAQIAKTTPKGSQIGLIGDLGAGKTTFVNGFYEALKPKEIPNEVCSPTFTLGNQYPLKKQGHLWHYDLYRLNSFDEFLELDFESFFQSEDILIIEWADKFKEVIESCNYLIFLEYETSLNPENENRNLRLFEKKATLK